MRVNSQPRAAVQNPAIKSSDSVRHSGKVKQAVSGSPVAGINVQNLNQPVLKNVGVEELGSGMESLGVEFNGVHDCRLWPDLLLFKSTREF